MGTRIDLDDVGVFNATMTVEQAAAWLMERDRDLPQEVNQQIDNAAGFAGDCGNAFVVIQITPKN